jgi:hypothetical protein
VIVRNVQNVQQENLNPDGSIWYDYYFLQNGVRMNYDLDTKGKPYFTFYDNMDITGVVDDRIIGTMYSVWPLSQAHIVDLDNPSTDVDKVGSNVKIYSAGKTIFVEAQKGASISVFTLQGQCLFDVKSEGSITQIKNIENMYVVVMVDNIAYKVMIK